MKVIITRPLYFHSYLDDDDYGPLTYIKDRMVFYSNDYEELLAHQQTIKSFLETYQFILIAGEKDAHIRRKNSDIRIAFEFKRMVSSEDN